MNPVSISKRLAKDFAELAFGWPTACVYNPLVYAWRPHEAYLRRYAVQGVEAVLVEMTPGPRGDGANGCAVW